MAEEFTSQEFILPTADNLLNPPPKQEDVSNKDGFFLTVEDMSPRYATGQTTKADNNDDQAITGLGFTPRLVKIIAFHDNTDDGSWSWGVSTGPASNIAQELRLFNLGTASATSVQYSTDLVHVDTLTTGITAVIKSFDADGFTLDWSGLSAGKTCYFQWEAYG